MVARIAVHARERDAAVQLTQPALRPTTLHVDDINGNNTYLELRFIGFADLTPGRTHGSAPGKTLVTPDRCAFEAIRIVDKLRRLSKHM